jgi:hypothetical protein
VKEAKRKEMEKSIKQTAIQRTTARMRAKLTKNLKPDLLLFYLKTLLKLEHEGEDVSMTFVKDLEQEGSDINLKDDASDENALFLVRNFFLV